MEIDPYTIQAILHRIYTCSTHASFWQARLYDYGFLEMTVCSSLKMKHTNLKMKLIDLLIVSKLIQKLEIPGYSTTILCTQWQNH